MDTVIVGQHGVNDNLYQKGQSAIILSPPVFGLVWPPSSDPQILPVADRHHFAQNNKCVVGTIYLT